MLHSREYVHAISKLESQHAIAQAGVGPASAALCLLVVIVRGGGLLHPLDVLQLRVRALCNINQPINLQWWK